MTRAEKRTFRYQIVQLDMNINFAEDSFFELPMYKIYKLGDYAEIFHIRSKDGKSPARTLFDQLHTEWIKLTY